MIEYLLGPADLARVRFARSPMLELASSVRVLAAPREPVVHRPWLAVARPKVDGLGLKLLPALLGNPYTLPDFVLPEPDGDGREFTEEFEQIRAATGAAIRADLEEIRPLPPAVRPLYDEPERELGRLVDELAMYWRAAIEPIWPRLRALYEADLGYRARELTKGGVDRLLAQLHPDIEYTPNRLRIRKPQHNHRRVLDGTGILLVPCVFAWPKLLASTSATCHPTITYVPRGIAGVWAGTPGTGSAPLAELIGRSRAALLAQLDLPLSTTQLAAHLGMTAATVSEHLAVLRRNQLVERRPAGRSVLYQRTALATKLVSASHGNESSP